MTRDLVQDPVPHLDAATVAVFYAGDEPEIEPVPAGVAMSDQLVAELEEADDILVSSALYNFAMPSALKAWVDHIVRLGRTVAYGINGPQGLLCGKRVTLITARGGTADSSPDFQRPTLRAVFAYIGVTDIQTVHLEGTKTPDGALEARVEKARDDVDSLFHGGDPR